VVLERDVFCPYCQQNTAVLISETVKTKMVKGCAPIGCKNSILLCVTGGCWALAKGIPLNDYNEEFTTNLYGFCPCCGNTYPVIKPKVEEKTVIDRFNDTKESFSRLAGQAKGMFNRNNSNNYDQNNVDPNSYNQDNNNQY